MKRKDRLCTRCLRSVGASVAAHECDHGRACKLRAGEMANHAAHCELCYDFSKTAHYRARRAHLETEFYKDLGRRLPPARDYQRRNHQ